MFLPFFFHFPCEIKKPSPHPATVRFSLRWHYPDQVKRVFSQPVLSKTDTSTPVTYKFTEGGQTRTADHLLKRQMLYRLSYTPIGTSLRLCGAYWLNALMLDSPRHSGQSPVHTKEII
jgi:hypothetical protein